MKLRLFENIMTFAWLFLAAAVALAHVQPPRELVSERDAVNGLLGEAKTISKHDVRFSPEQRQAVKKEWGWRPSEKFYRCYVGHDAQGRLVGAVVFVGEITIHGLVRMAVGIGPDGKITGATVVAVTDENFTWVKPHIEQNFARNYIGQDGRGNFSQGERVQPRKESMAKYYGQVLANLVQHGAIVCEAGHLRDVRSTS